MMNPGKAPGFFVMENTTDDLSIEYFLNPSPDAEERLAQAFDLILSLILEDIKSEQQPEPESETC
jgi:hypothetical protein